MFFSAGGRAKPKVAWVDISNGIAVKVKFVTINTCHYLRCLHVADKDNGFDAGMK